MSSSSKKENSENEQNSEKKQKIKDIKGLVLEQNNLIDVLFPLKANSETESNNKQNDPIEVIFKLNKLKCPIEKSVSLYDVKLKGKGFDEDKFFKKNPQVLKILRRGNTIIELPNEERFIGRKGFEKFFDLDDLFIQNNLGDNINSEKKDVRDIIFKDIEEAFQNGHKVKIFKTEKANGENCQFSFFKPLPKGKQYPGC